VCNHNAVIVEAASFDACPGHPPRNGEYHHLHQNPVCLYSTADTTVHAPLVGYAFDGFPISSTYPLGDYPEDDEYVAGLGDLDEHNGRFCVTPEHP